MKSLFDNAAYAEMVGRINQLASDSQNQWGKMTVNQMLCHVTDPIRDILGIRQTTPVTPPEMWPQIKAMVLVEEDWSENLPTFPPYLQGEGGGGTPPVGFEQDRTALIDLLQEFINTPVDYTFQPHAGIGLLTRNEFGQLIWKHTDHHLRSFGV